CSVSDGKHIDYVRGVTRLRLILLVSTMILAGPAGVFAQGSSSSTPVSQTPAGTFRSGVELVTVTAAVRDARGRVVRDLQKSDFAVVDSRYSRPIQDFYAGESA